MVGFPLLLIPLAICNIIVFLMPGVSFGAPLFGVPLMSGASWPVTLSDALLTLGLFLLLLEIVKGARPLGRYLMDHLLALLIFAGAAAEFVLLPQFANSTFFLLTLLALIDFLGGVSLRARRARRLAAAATVPVDEERLREPRLAQATPAAEPTPILQPAAPVSTIAAAPEILETVPAHSSPGSDLHSVRTEPIINTRSEEMAIERERRPDEFIVSTRTTPAS